MKRESWEVSPIENVSLARVNMNGRQIYSRWRQLLELEKEQKNKSGVKKPKQENPGIFRQYLA